MTPREIDTITAEVCAFHGVPPSKVRVTAIRAREVVAARAAIWRKCHEQGAPLAQIARHFDAHHTSVMHAIRRTA